ncbi:SCO family protein [Hydrogenovibrio kuenenii]|uniref:SCO family protein n=1 Tax=Hydrogenovibrio kuenenii TaxID=63658 RepID=UPI0004667156|nr:SCO family protein [Hydrogenovibrio kuenenii]
MSQRLRLSFILIGLVILLMAGLMSFGWLNKLNTHPSQSAIAPAPVGGDFTAISSKGNVSLSDFKGKWVYLYFGYTFCPDICPTNLGNMSGAYQQLTPEEKKQVQFIFFSVDPKRDTPKRMQEYSNYFDMNLLGVTAKKAVIDDVTKRYGAVYSIHHEKGDGNNYSVDHSAFTYVISPTGKLMEQIPHGTDSQGFLNNIRKHLHQTTAH